MHCVYYTRNDKMCVSYFVFYDIELNFNDSFKFSLTILNN